MRIAVLADIHANLPALDAVLADIEAVGVDAIVLNGDMVTGPMPVATLDRLAALGDRAVWVHGNCEREVVQAWDGGGVDHLPEVARESTSYTAAQLSRGHRDLIDVLPLTVVLDVDGLGPVLFCHASTRNDTDVVLVDSPVERYQDCFADLAVDTVVLGHTHMPFDRLVDRRRFVNPGSVGMPYGRMGASWALLGPDVVLRCAAYDPGAAAAAMRSAAPDYPGLTEFLDENVCTVPSDAEALAVFRPSSLH
jgi:putative phosphoesterase